MIYLHNLRFLKDIYILGTGDQFHNPSFKIAFNVTECNRIHYQRFKIIDDMVEHLKSTSEARSPGLETLYSVPQPRIEETKSSLMTKRSSG